MILIYWCIMKTWNVRFILTLKYQKTWRWQNFYRSYTHIMSQFRTFVGRLDKPPIKKLFIKFPLLYPRLLASSREIDQTASICEALPIKRITLLWKASKYFVTLHRPTQSDITILIYISSASRAGSEVHSAAESPHLAKKL